jgi:hypothetical protein
MRMLLCPKECLLWLFDQPNHYGKLLQRIQRQIRKTSGSTADEEGPVSILSRQAQPIHGFIVILGGEERLLTPLPQGISDTRLGEELFACLDCDVKHG